LNPDSLIKNANPGKIEFFRQFFIKPEKRNCEQKILKEILKRKLFQKFPLKSPKATTEMLRSMNTKRIALVLCVLGVAVIAGRPDSGAPNVIAAPANTAKPGVKTLEAGFKWFDRNFDERYAGFSSKGPKFPTARNLSFLLTYWKRTGDKKALRMVEVTLDRIGRGGIHDQLGGGVYRYSADRKWLVPHFEKTLCDQALLARAYLEVYQVTKKEKYAEAARDILDYVIRDMAGPQGAFYSAENSGAEGIYYVWTKKEIDALLGQDAKIFEEYYGVTERGNFKRGTNILNVPMPEAEFLRKTGIDRAEFVRITKEGRKKLLARRRTRVRPRLDDKILTSWNGLMISTLAFGSRALDEPKYADAAAKAASFTLAKLYKNGVLYRNYRNGQTAIPGSIDDYASLTLGLIDLYEAAFDLKWIKTSRTLADAATAKFWDRKHGCFLFASGKGEKTTGRIAGTRDGAEPSGNSIAALALLKLGKLTMDEEYERKAAATISAFSTEVTAHTQAYAQMLIALDFEIGPSMEIVIAGETGDPIAADMIRLVNSEFLPVSVLAFYPVEKPGNIETLIPLTEFKELKDGMATAFICRNFTCKFPTNDIQQLRELLIGKDKP
jgi:uncharacterized protein